MFAGKEQDQCGQNVQTLRPGGGVATADVLSGVAGR